jgi:hypothetical protein
MVAMVGSQLVGGVLQSGAAKRAARAQGNAAQLGINEQRAAREDFNRRTQPFADIGLSAGSPLMDLLGLSQGGQGNFGFNAPANEDINKFTGQLSDIDAQIAEAERGKAAIASRNAQNFSQGIRGGGPLSMGDSGMGAIDAKVNQLNAQREALQGQLTQAQGLAQEQNQASQAQFNAGAGERQALSQNQQLEQIDPLLSFLRQEGFEDIQESAAARGRLGAGGTLKDLTKFNTQLTSTIVPQLQQQRFNQLFNVLGLGANTAAGQGTAGMQTAGNVSNLLGQQGQAQAAGITGRANAITGGINALGGLAGAQQGGAFGGGVGGFGGKPNSFNFLGGGTGGVAQANQFGNIA